jgi:hypothetical protein
MESNMAQERKYFTEKELDKLAAYVGMELPEFLRFRARGKFGVTPQPKDPEPVYFLEHIDRWLAANRPPQTNSPDPAGVLTVDPNREGA